MIDVTVEDGLPEVGDDEEYRNHLAKLEDILQLVAEEYITACHYFPPFRSAHEGVAIIDEEWQEFKAAAYWPHKEETGDEVDEARQLAAMAVRYMMDVCYSGKEVPR
jgi:hypothetical protein